jgi:four helix bundle protein
MVFAKSFHELEVWKHGRTLRKKLYGVAKGLPPIERYNLSAQIRAAAISLTSNIAEGFGRYHYKENLQFCRIARGSACELMDHLITCLDEHYIEAAQHQVLENELTSFLRLLNGYIRRIGQRNDADGAQ